MAAPRGKYIAPLPEDGEVNDEAEHFMRLAKIHWILPGIAAKRLLRPSDALG
jgi:hypothetical protein